jgi:hypothetical protein
MQFDELHRRWCLSICASLADRGLSRETVTYGRAAKLVAVYLKAIVMMGDRCGSRFARHMHPPIDRTLLQGLATSKAITSSHQPAWRSISWTQLNRASYDELVDQLREVIPADKPFWTIEEYWEPSDTEDDAL